MANQNCVSVYHAGSGSEVATFHVAKTTSKNYRLMAVEVQNGHEVDSNIGAEPHVRVVDPRIYEIRILTAGEPDRSMQINTCPFPIR